jgi:hypothetical protein
VACGVNSAEIDEKAKAEKNKSRTVACTALLGKWSMHIAWAWTIMHKHGDTSNVLSAWLPLSVAEKQKSRHKGRLFVGAL